jgi:hypothetical protein
MARKRPLRRTADYGYTQRRSWDPSSNGTELLGKQLTPCQTGCLRHHEKPAAPAEGQGRPKERHPLES